MHLEMNTFSLCLSDDDLIGVSGGSTIQDERGIEVKEGRFITSKVTNYSSGEFPKFSVGDMVKIKWHISSEQEVLCNAEIMGVNDTKSSGLLFRKYTYVVKILTCPNTDMIGLIESDVHENCLYL